MKTISLAQAFAHCASTGSYWWGIGIVVALCIAAVIILTRANRKSEVNPIVKNIIYFAILAAIALAIFMRPCSVAANTSVDAAARGNYIGY